MAVSIEQYRQRIGCFARVATILSSCGVRSNNNSNTCRKQSKHSRTDLRLVIRLGCLVVLVAAIIQSSSLVLDLTQFGDVEKNPGPNFAQKYKFHNVHWKTFEDLSTTVLSEKYKLPFLRFKTGPDGGRDAVAKRVNIDFGGENVHYDQNVVVQVKHTTDESEKFKDIFKDEEEKVKKLVEDNELDIYIIVTNYKLPAGQSDKLEATFKTCGAKEVFVFGNETLTQWLKDSQQLQQKVLRQYPEGLINDLSSSLKAAQSVQLLFHYEKYLCNKIIDLEAFTKAKEIVISDTGLVFITGDRGTGKTTVAKQLFVQLFDEYAVCDITSLDDFKDNWNLDDQKQVFFMDNIDSDDMNKWYKLKDRLEMVIEHGSKFVFAGESVVLKEAQRMSKEPGHDVFYDRLCKAAIDLSDPKFNLSDDKKQEMLRKRIEIGDNDDSTKEALLKDDMVSYAATINCPCFPLVASSLGCKNTFDKFKEDVPSVYNKAFLDQFFKWVQSAVGNGHDITAHNLHRDVEMGDNDNLSVQSTADSGDDITGLKEILSDEYKYRATHLHPLPWLDTTQFELDKVYTKLGIIQREHKKSELTNKTVELSDIFDNHEYKSVKPRTILIEGSPGMGKTTLSLKLAYDWAMGKMPRKFPPIQLVFLIKCRDMKCDIFEAIRDQLLPLDKDGLKKELPQFVQKHQDKILLVVDGLDETPERAEEHVMTLLARKYMQKCYVVATSRQEKGLKVRKYFDTLLEIKGYSEHDISNYIHKYFADELDLAHGLLSNLHDNSRLKTLATNPLNTVLLCVVFEDYDGQLPSTLTELYDKIVLCITEQYRGKYDLRVEDKLFETYKETLGKLAYKGLLEDSLSFHESDLNVDGIHIQCTEMGFLYKEVSRRKIEPDHTYWFLHKTFQEYLVAFYFTNTFETVDDMVEKLKDTAKFMQVLMFVSGMLRKKDAGQCRNFVQKLGTVLLQSIDKNNVVGILCAVLSESFVDENMARIIYQFLPENLLAIPIETPYAEYVAKILPGILNLLCTKDGVYQEVHFNELSFSNKVSTSDVGLICKVLKEKLKVKELNLDKCGINNEAISALADMLSHNTTVEDIDISFNSLNAEAAEILGKGLSQNTTLRELNVSENELGDAGVKAIAAALTHDTSFKDMAARNNDDGDNEDDKRRSTLHTLHIQDTECGEDGASAVADMLRTNNTLTELSIADNPLGSKGFTHLAEALKLNKTLEIIWLENTDCGNEGAAAIADMLCINETLTKLYLENFIGNPPHENKIGKNGAVALADALKVNKSLKELHLTNNDITDEGVECLIEALVVNTTLDKLCIKYPGDDSRSLENDEPLKKKRRAEGRIIWNCYQCLNIV